MGTLGETEKPGLFGLFESTGCVVVSQELEELGCGLVLGTVRVQDALQELKGLGTYQGQQGGPGNFGIRYFVGPQETFELGAVGRPLLDLGVKWLRGTDMGCHSFGLL